ncbi:MAG: TonB-dependent receptor [Flavobacteriaceae bacterium]|nr:TonB-dependent receptor [Flavobacteriaceae bacterium]
MIKNFRILIFLFLTYAIKAQEIKQDSLNEVVVTSSRIDLPFSKNSRTITIINAEQIQNSVATNVADLLQEVAGVDVRRRGVDGMQSDIYIRGGHFNQTLILIDGIKTEDPQTGHHSMNIMMPLENIERIEIIKGPAARIFGQNAFTGAINIVTKSNVKKKLSLAVNYGSYEQKSISLTATNDFNYANMQVNYNYAESEGYRENTDFKNHNVFLKSSFKTKKNSINILATFADRKFGANNFYTNNVAFNEYEETQTSLVGVSTKYNFNKFQIKPKIYWRRNQDMFLLKRKNPEFSRNFNISNKIGAEINTSYKSKIGTTGLGLDVAKVSLSSNNLGDQERTMLTAFLEHRFQLANNRLDITPGVSISYFSDFESNIFPGFDIGYKVNTNFKLYWNFGYSYRVPTYIELYVNIPNFLSGNENLEQEKAVSQEMGFKYNKNNFKLSGAIFNRVATNLIDYIKENQDSPFFIAQNLRKITTQGFEVNANYEFEILNLKQQLNLGYTFLNDDYKGTNVFASRYLINTSIKHHFTTSLQTQFFKNVRQSIIYKYVERPLNNYNVVDAKVSLQLADFRIFALVNNIFNTEYIEQANILMPKGNLIFGVQYEFD